MPRVNPLRTLANESNLARRIRFEREQRSWTYEGTASRMATAGFVIQSSAIYKIEKGDPPRRITVDEMVGFATVFDVSVENLLIPVELINERAVLELHTKLDELRSQLRGTVVSLHAAVREWVNLLQNVQPARRAFLKMAITNVQQVLADQVKENGDLTVDEFEGAREGARLAALPYPDYVDEAVRAVFEATNRWAGAESLDSLVIGHG